MRIGTVTMIVGAHDARNAALRLSQPGILIDAAGPESWPGGSGNSGCPPPGAVSRLPRTQPRPMAIRRPHAACERKDTCPSLLCLIRI